ncbi:DUF771 domain-containing protein [Staphylococcus simulans]|uniref:DUF771 domain-containing protein n=1 Tax=Staphylococcus simulans TaxID=1286 RepID=UPI000D1E073E|nr:DUF771 domain-containing protein [Staphylococcus simulans]PTJ91670.1 DUF771 domain-containing protein [Staphylococcus simulans]
MTQSLSVQINIPEQYVLIEKDIHTQLLMNQQKATWSKKEFINHSPFKSETTVNKRILDMPKFRKILEGEGIATYPGNGIRDFRFDGPKAYEFLRKYRDEF